MLSIYDVSLSFVLVRMLGVFGRIKCSNLVSHDLLFIMAFHH